MRNRDEELVRAIRRGEQGAFDALVRRHDRKVLAIAFGYTQDAEEAKDIYQEVFLKVYRGLESFEFRSSFSTWLYRITVNTCLSRPRRERFEPLEAGAACRVERAGAERQLYKRELGDLIEEAMSALSPRQKMVFTLRHYQGYRLREIAALLECAEGTVKNHLFLATRRLRRHLEKRLEHPGGL